MNDWLRRSAYLLCREIIWLRALVRFMLGHTEGVTWLIVHRRWGTLDELVKLLETQDE